MFLCAFVLCLLVFSCEKEKEVYRATEATVKGSVQSALESLEWNEELYKDGIAQKQKLSLEGSAPVEMLTSLPPYVDPVVAKIAAPEQNADHTRGGTKGKHTKPEAEAFDAPDTFDAPDAFTDGTAQIEQASPKSQETAAARSKTREGADGSFNKGTVGMKDVYPTYKDFGSLDVSFAPRDMLDFCSEFLQKTVYLSVNARSVPYAMLDASYPFLPLLVSEQLAIVPKTKRALFGTCVFTDGVWEVRVRCEGAGTHNDLVLFVSEKSRGTNGANNANGASASGKNGANAKSSYAIEQLYVGECVHE